MAVARASSMNDIQRKRVIWFGSKPSSINLDEFSHRYLTVDFLDSSDKDKLFFPTATAIIFKFDSAKIASFKNLWSNFAEEAINHGLLLYIVTDIESIPQLQKITKEIEDKIMRPNGSSCKYCPQSEILFSSKPESCEIAERIARHDSGPAENQELKIDRGDFSEAKKLLIRRSFFDYESVEIIEPFDEDEGGLSGVDVFSVYAKFKGSPEGNKVLPFLIKIGERNKIEDEIVLHNLYVRHFIPFNLRPNLHINRCLLGFEEGIMVADFVEQSETLRKVAHRGAAHAAIYSIFDDAFRGWRLKPLMHKEVEKNLVMEMLGVVKSAEIPPERVKKAKEKFNVKKSPAELMELLKSLKNQPYYESYIHGDLHASNVLVRRNDAILIDFAKTKKGPIVADAAALEVSLAFDKFIDDKSKDDKLEDDSDWRGLVDKLYQFKFLIQPPELNEKFPAREWLWKCVRQIRIMALATTYSKHEYGTAVAIYLLRRSMRKAIGGNDFRWTYAYVLAEKIILELVDKVGTVIK